MESTERRPDLRPPTSGLLGVYVHIPFCSSICNYCNFNRGLFDADLKRRYVDALVADIARARLRDRDAADTIYFGGGTPSLLSADDVTRIIDACRRSFSITLDAEIRKPEPAVALGMPLDPIVGVQP